MKTHEAVKDHPATDTMDDQIKELVIEIREAQAFIAQHEAEIQHAKEQLYPLLMAKESNWTDETGYARLVSEGTRIAYNTSALDELIIHDPLRYGWLKDYRNESTIASRIQVK